MSSVTCASRVSELDAEAHIAQYVTVLAHLLLWAVQRACRRFASGNVTKAECPDWKRAYAPSTAHISPFTARCSGCWVAIGALVASAPGVQAEEGRALHVTDDTARHLRYTSRAKREADVSLSHRRTMEHPVAPWSTTSDATGVTTPRQTVKASPHRHKWMLTHGAPADPAQGRGHPRLGLSGTVRAWKRLYGKVPGGRGPRRC